MVNDFSTYDSEEKIAKLNQEFENYNKHVMKERQSDYGIRKRKHSELDQELYLGCNDAANQK